MPSKKIRILTGYTERKVSSPPANRGNPQAARQRHEPRSSYIRIPNYSWITIPGNTISVPSPPRIIPGRIRARNVKQKINFEAIIGGEENPRFTAPIETDTTELGVKTEKINTDTESLIDKFNNQKEQLNNIFNKATDFLSRNQFIN